MVTKGTVQLSAPARNITPQGPAATVQAPAAAADGSMRFLAKQPIMTAARKTIGYELLFRATWENRFSGDGESASNSIVDWAVTHGFESLVGETKPFVNCTRALLVSRCATLLPKGTVLEILENVEADEEVLEACRYYRSQGFALALDDYDFREQWEPLLDIVQYVKIDFSQSTPEDRKGIIKRLKPRGMHFVAERIEDADQLKAAVAEGFDFFQGYFFMKPVMTARRGPGKSIHQLQLLAEICKQDLNLESFLRILRSEPSICYRVLRYVNSAAVSSRRTITDLRHAVMLIGEDESRRIVRTALAAELTGGSGIEAMERCVQRARFCELLATDLNSPREELYLMGMLSAVLPLLEMDVKDAAANLPLREEVIAALTDPATEEAHAQALSLAVAYERGDWGTMIESCHRLGIAEDDVAAKHYAAEQWTSAVVHHL
jgi:EAL and modified HD-GYP domain-containing signal transduction protein